MTEVIALALQKGGVSKTTNTINLAGATASQGHSVLAVDADPQGYLTNRLGFKDVYESSEPNLFSSFIEPNTFTQDIIEEHDEFDVLPSNADMFTLERKLERSDTKPLQRFTELTERITGYDFIFIDAPPSLGPINDNVLLGSDGLLIPCEADDSSILALEHLFNQIDTLADQFGETIDERGILVSNVNYPLDKEQQGMLDWYEDTFGGRCPIHIVRNRAAIKRAMNNGVSIFSDEAEDTDMKEVYLDVIDSLEGDQ